MKATLFSFLPNVFPIRLKENGKAEADYELKWKNFIVTGLGSEEIELRARLPATVEAEALARQGYEVRKVLLVPITLSVYLSDPPDDINHLRREVISLIKVHLEEKFDEVHVLPASGHFRLTVSGLPHVITAPYGDLRFEAFYALRSELLSSKPDLAVFDVTYLSGQVSTTILEAFDFALADYSFLAEREVRSYAFSAESFDEFSAAVRVQRASTITVSPQTVRARLEKVENIGRIRDKPIETKGRSFFGELMASFDACSPLYFLQRLSEEDLSGLYSPEEFEAMVWDQARVEKRAEYRVEFETSLTMEAVKYVLWRDVAKKLRDSIGNPPFTLDKIESLNAFFHKACLDHFVNSIKRPLEFLEGWSTGRDEFSLAELDDLLHSPLADHIGSLKEGKLIVPERKRKCRDPEWKPFGLIEEAIKVTKDGKVEYFEECWKGIIKAFREVAGL
jgi:hypothetical protein